MTKEVIILGKPNVGKSSLFNSLVGKKLALVENFPGLTRDLRRKSIVFLDQSYVLIDSAGISEKLDPFDEDIVKSTLDAISKTTLILFVVDGAKGLSNEDYNINSLLKKYTVKKLLIVNKCEGKINPYIQEDCSKLGLGDPIYVSAEHKIGIGELKYKINTNIESTGRTQKEEDISFDHSVAIVGRPNSGKSTLINSLKGSNISLTGSVPNLTRDPVETSLTWKNLNFKVFDTAGIAKNTRNLEKIERISVLETKRKIRLSEIIILTMDINNYFEKFNLKLMRLILNESRCLIIVINKIDMIKEYSEHYIKNIIFKSFPALNKVPIYFISAEKKIGLDKLMRGIISFLPHWQKRVSTNQLNNWLKKISNKNPPPLYNGREVKLKFISQVNSRPPKFVLFTNFPRSIKESYKRYILNDLKKTFKFDGVIVNLVIAKSKNPYETH